VAFTVAPAGTTRVGSGSQSELEPEGHEYTELSFTVTLPTAQTAGSFGVTATPLGLFPVEIVLMPGSPNPLITAALLLPGVVTNTANPSLVNAIPFGLVWLTRERGLKAVSVGGAAAVVLSEANADTVGGSLDPVFATNRSGLNTPIPVGSSPTAKGGFCTVIVPVGELGRTKMLTVLSPALVT